MSQENVEIVRQIYAHGLLDVAAPAQLVASGIEYVNPPDAVIPGTRHGEDVAGAVGSLGETFQWREHRLLRVFDAGDAVVADVLFSARGAASGAEVQQHEAHTWTFQGGKLVRFEWSRDLRSALRAVGLEE